MGASAEFHGIAVKGTGRAPDLNDTDEITIFVSEELQNARASFHLRERKLLPTHGGILQNAFVHESVHLRDLFRSHGSAGEVEGQLVRTDEGTLLGDRLS